MNAEIEIKKATKEDAETIFDILQVCADWLSAEKGLNHWKKSISEGLISLQTVLNSIENDETFLIFDNGAEIGTITASRQRPKYYADFPPSWKNGNALYLKKLAVLPSYHSKGLAVALLNFVGEKAKREGVDFLRLDCVANLAFYSKRGFTLLGKSLTKYGTPINFFEKALSSESVSIH